MQQREDIEVVSHGPNFEELYLDPERSDRHRNQPKWITVKVLSNVPPKQCGEILKHLSQVIPLKPEHVSDVARWLNLSHLRRVRRFSREASKANQNTEIATSSKVSKNVVQGRELDASPERKRPKQATTIDSKGHKDHIVLEVLLCEEFRWGHLANSVKRDLLEKFQLDPSSIKERKVPGRPAESKEELDMFNNNNNFVISEKSDPQESSPDAMDWWPTLYFHGLSKEHQIEKLTLPSEDLKRFERGMNECLLDATVAKEQVSSMPVKIHSSVTPTFQCGAIVMCPKTGEVVARASTERLLQFNRMEKLLTADQGGACRDLTPNPLQTSILLAIQGVSRVQRNTALTAMGASSDTAQSTHGVETARDSLKSGQYLCTGFEVYTTIEPPIYEAMALLHSRVSRVIYGAPQSIGTDPEDGGFSETAIHSLPGANHSFRAFRCVKSTDLYERCCNVHCERSKK